MPELPEVETIRRQLEKYLVGHKVTRIKVLVRKIFKGKEKLLTGAKVKRMRRFAKVLVIDFSNGYSLVIHLKMTGQVLYQGPNLEKSVGLSEKFSQKHVHVIFHLDRGGTLMYSDYRKFGWLRVVKTAGVEKLEFIKKLGPEPFVNPNTFRPNETSKVNRSIFTNKFSTKGAGVNLTSPIFKKIVMDVNRPIKVLLLDQSKIGGIGNIYANDALWLAGIDPGRKAKELKEGEVKKLYRAIHSVLKQGLKWGGASEQSYITPDGGEGKYQEHFLVYEKAGEKCARCKKAKIQKFFLGGRGTYMCSRCQR